MFFTLFMCYFTNSHLLVFAICWFAFCLLNSVVSSADESQMVCNIDLDFLESKLIGRFDFQKQVSAE